MVEHTDLLIAMEEWTLVQPIKFKEVDNMPQLGADKDALQIKMMKGTVDIGVLPDSLQLKAYALGALGSIGERDFQFNADQYPVSADANTTGPVVAPG